MAFLKRFYLLFIGILLFLGISFYKVSIHIPEDDELIRVSAKIETIWKTKSIIKVRLENERYRTFYAIISKNNLKGIAKEFDFVNGQEIWIDVLESDFQAARLYNGYTFNPIFGFGTDQREISNLSLYIKNKTRKESTLFVFLVSILILSDYIFRKRIKIKSNIQKGSIPQIIKKIESVIKRAKPIKGDLAKVLIGSALFVFVLWMQLIDRRIFDYSDLRSLQLILVKNPEYHTYWIKGTTYREIKLKAYGYNKEFRITSVRETILK